MKAKLIALVAVAVLVGLTVDASYDSPRATKQEQDLSQQLEEIRQRERTEEQNRRSMQEYLDAQKGLEHCQSDSCREVFKGRMDQAIDDSSRNVY